MAPSLLSSSAVKCPLSAPNSLSWSKEEKTPHHGPSPSRAALALTHGIVFPVIPMTPAPRQCSPSEPHVPLPPKIQDAVGSAQGPARIAGQGLLQPSWETVLPPSCLPSTQAKKSWSLYMGRDCTILTIGENASPLAQQ